MQYAPTLIFVHTRFNHFKNCIDSLLKCPEAKYTELYISSDYYRNEEEKKNVLQIRNYINSIKGFKKVKSYLFKKNVGIKFASEYCRREVLNKYDKIIILEDDIVVSPFFLYYLNRGLEFYKNDPKVFSICGFSPDTFSKNYEQIKPELYKSNRWNAWGFGIWKDRYMKFEEFRNNEAFNKILMQDLNSKFFRKKINSLSLEHYPHFLNSVKKNSKPEFDFSVGYYCTKKELFNIYFTKTHTINNGNDGSGLRAKNNRFLKQIMTEKKLHNKKFNFQSSDELYHTNDMPRPPQNIIIISIKLILIRLNIFDFTKIIIKKLKS
tara:strand:- start:2616 stop:3581 length:966 start_codon:yes stop_codon:yes gene_type:complete